VHNNNDDDDDNNNENTFIIHFFHKETILRIALHLFVRLSIYTLVSLHPLHRENKRTIKTQIDYAESPR